MLFTGILIVLWILFSSPWAPELPPVLPFHLAPPTFASSLAAAALTCSLPQFVKAIYFVQRDRNMRRKTSNHSKSRDPVAMKECEKSKRRSSSEIDLPECEGDSQGIDFPCHHGIVLCPYPLSHHILPCIRIFLVGLLRPVTKTTQVSMELNELPETDFWQEVKWGDCYSSQLRESKITVLVISQLLICHSVPKITHLTHMVPFQEMTSKPCRAFLYNYNS